MRDYASPAACCCAFGYVMSFALAAYNHKELGGDMGFSVFVFAAFAFPAILGFIGGKFYPKAKEEHN